VCHLLQFDRPQSCGRRGIARASQAGLQRKLHGPPKPRWATGVAPTRNLRPRRRRGVFSPALQRRVDEAHHDIFFRLGRGGSPSRGAAEKFSSARERWETLFPYFGGNGPGGPCDPGTGGLSFQARIQTGGGADINGPVTVGFRIYGAQTGATVLWGETQSLYAVRGLVSVELGRVNPLPDGLFNDPERYLGITVAGDPEMAPRRSHRLRQRRFRLDRDRGIIRRMAGSGEEAVAGGAAGFDLRLQPPPSPPPSPPPAPGG